MPRICAQCRDDYDARLIACPSCGRPNPAPVAVPPPRSPAAATARPEEVLTRTFRAPFFQPSTNLGHFDVEVDLNRGRMLIRVRMAFSYQSMYYALAHPGAHAPPGGHDQALIALFDATTRRVVPEVWNGRFELRLRRHGWPAVALRPEFVVEPSRLVDAHYEVELSDASRDWSSAVVTEVPAHGVRAHMAKFSSDAIGTPQSDFKLRSIISDLVAGYAIPMANYDAILQRERRSASLLDMLLTPTHDGEIFGRRDHEEWRAETGARLRELPGQTAAAQRRSDARGEERLRHFVTEFRKVVGTADYARFRIAVTLHAPVNRYGSLIALVHEVLSPREQAIMTVTHTFAAMGSEHRSITIALRAAELRPEDPAADHVEAIAAVVMRSSLMLRPHFQQVTICHEFGHMLGLPDEYICITERSRDLLRGLDVHRTSSTFDVERWLEFQAPASGTSRDNATTSENQARFLGLCREAGVAPPMFGRKNSSLMSAGMTFSLCHGVTLWEAVTRATGEFFDPHEWTLHLVRE